MLDPALVALGGKCQQFRGGLEVVSCVGVVNMPHVSSQCRQHPLNVDACLVPRHQALDREAVAEVMKSWSSAFRSTQSGPECQVGKHFLESILGVPSAAGMHEEGLIIAVREGSFAHSGESAQDLESCAVKWNKAALAELALSDDKYSGFQVYVGTIQTNHFADAQPGTGG